jgi:MFS superfamily sulfate permease-like transporter
LIVGIILAAKIDSTSALIMFGLMQIMTGFVYQMPMPVQPLKAMATIVITQKLTGSVLYGAGLAIGFIMLFFSISGLLDWLAKFIPKSVVRGIQFGLGLQLATLALKEYVPADGIAGYWLTFIAFLITLFLLNNTKYPAAIFLILLGFIYAFSFKFDASTLISGIGFSLPIFHLPTWSDIFTGFLLLALPQIPLSLGNSILATRQIAEDLFQRKLTVKQIGLTYAFMNLINPFFGGVPTCHGSGGMAGHYAFGARTGGSVVIEGTLYLILGLFFGRVFETVVNVFPLPILGVILFFEGLTLMMLVKDTSALKSDLIIVLIVGLISVGIPYGHLVGLIVGTSLAYLMKHGIVELEVD